MKHNARILILAVLLIGTLLASSLFSVHTVRHLMQENNKGFAYLFATEIGDKIEDVFSECLTVSQTLNNSILRRIIADSELYTPEERSRLFGGYLSDVVLRFQYDTAFLALTDDMSYYSEHGFSKILSVDDPADVWFFDFWESGQSFELKIDNDAANEGRTTVYINTAILSESGNFVAACGVGLSLSKISDLLENLHSEYDLSIRILSPTGFITFSSDAETVGSKCGEETISAMKSVGTSEEILYEPNSDSGYRVMRYLSSCRWYLNITREGSELSGFSEVIRNIFIFFSVAVLIIAVVTIVFGLIGKKNEMLRQKSITDRLTGIFNREYYETRIAEIRAGGGDVSDISALMIDIDGLKLANDRHGHKAGDELIRGAADCITAVADSVGEVFRIGGDEFVVLYRENVDLAFAAQNIRALASDWKGNVLNSLSLSVGYASGKADRCDTIEEILSLADQRMYDEKKEKHAERSEENQT